MQIGLLKLFIGFLISFGLTWVLVLLWIRISLRAEILDVPNERSSHRYVTPRGGGVAIVLMVLLGLGVALVLGVTPDRAGVLWAGGMALFVAGISLIDDITPLPSLFRLLCHVIAGLAVVAHIGPFATLTLPVFEVVMAPAWLATVLSVLWVIGLTNVYNFMDGIDGIAGAQGVIAGLAWCWFGVAFQVPVVALAGIVVAGACGGFLLHNWSPAKVFMGDVGSAFLGFMFAIIPFLALRGQAMDAKKAVEWIGAVPMFALIVMWPFVADGLITFLRRVKHRKNVLRAHRTHLYQRLTIVGWSHAKVSRLYVWWAVFAAVSAGLYQVVSHRDRALLFAALACSLVVQYLIVREYELKVLTKAANADDTKSPATDEVRVNEDVRVG